MSAVAIDPAKLEQFVVVAGPRIDPRSLPAVEGLEVVPYVHNL